MASIVHPRSARARVMAVLKAYIDESGFGGPTFALCGFVATEAQWKNVEDGWQKLLDHPCRYEIETKEPITPSVLEVICRPLEYLHAKSMDGMGEGRFRRIGQLNRTHLIDSSIRIIVESGIVGVGTGVVISAFEKLSDEAKKVARSPYLMCMRYILAEMARKSQMFVGEDEDIAYIFEDQAVWELKAHELYAELRTEFQQEYRMGTLAFGCKRKFKPLQVADRLAYETFQHFSDPIHDRPHWMKFVKHPLISGNYCDERGVEIINARFAGSPVPYYFSGPWS
jgi:hypothetical protein